MSRKVLRNYVREAVNFTGFTHVKPVVKPVKFTRDSGCLARDSEPSERLQSKIYDMILESYAEIDSN